MLAGPADAGSLLRQLAQEFFIGPVATRTSHAGWRADREGLCRRLLEAAEAAGDQQMRITAMFFLYRSNVEHNEAMRDSILARIGRLDASRLKARDLVELSLVLVVLEEEELATKYITLCKSSLGFEHRLKGCLGLRSRHQENKVAILQVHVEAAKEHTPVDKSDGCLPCNVQLDDEDLFDVPVVDDCDSTPIDELCCALLLVAALYVERFETRDDSASEKIEALVAKVLTCTRSWAIRRMALYMRSLTECKRSKFVARSARQLQSLLDETALSEPGLDDRFEHFAIVYLPDVQTLSNELASSLIDCGDYVKAGRLLQSLGSLTQAAVCFVNAGMVEEGLGVLNLALERSPQDHVAAYLIGGLKQDESYFRKAWEVSKFTYYPAVRALGLLLYQRDDLVEARELFGKLADANPTTADNWFLLGCCLLKLQSWGPALDAFKRVIALDHDHLQAWNNLAVIHMHADNLEQAQHAVKMSIRLDFDTWKLWENLFRISLQLGDLSECVFSYRRLLEIRGAEAGLFPLLKLVEAVSEVCSAKDQVPGIESLVASMDGLLHTLDPMFSEHQDYVWLKSEFVNAAALSSMRTKSN